MVATAHSDSSDRAPGPRTEREQLLWSVLESVLDPEIPVVSIVDLGIVRYVRERTDAHGHARWHVGLTPTYSGCPATEVIRQTVRRALDEHGCRDVILDEVLTPPWSSDWLTAAGRRKLQSFGIAPPDTAISHPRHRMMKEPACPRCGSRATRKVSEFGSTPCKAHYQCTACLEPFDYFKCI